MHGTAFKGPYVEDSEVEVSTAAGQQRMTRLDARASYAAPIDGSAWIQVRVGGTFFDEVSGEIADPGPNPLFLYLLAVAPLERRASDLTVHVNPVASIASNRAFALVDEGLPLVEAVQQAETELVAALGLGPPTFGLSGPAAAVDPFGGDSDDNAYLVLVSSVLLTWAHQTLPTAPDQALETIVDDATSSMAQTGTLPESTRTSIADAVDRLDAPAVRAHLESRYAELGIDAVVPDFERLLAETPHRAGPQ